MELVPSHRATIEKQTSNRPHSQFFQNWQIDEEAGWYSAEHVVVKHPERVHASIVEADKPTNRNWIKMIDPKMAKFGSGCCVGVSPPVFCLDRDS